ncbi:unnamed protein product [[Candida] boidinii]|uniref:Unnamed protein product n=1 Tax=Candida boidinii TaxID=5477 RepID=A0ACB5TEK6_CANBO|nr:unnamed protein product [[Candida] boidinii]
MLSRISKNRRFTTPLLVYPNTYIPIIHSSITNSLNSNLKPSTSSSSSSTSLIGNIFVKKFSSTSLFQQQQQQQQQQQRHKRESSSTYRYQSQNKPRQNSYSSSNSYLRPRSHSISNRNEYSYKTDKRDIKDINSNSNHTIRYSNNNYKSNNSNFSNFSKIRRNLIEHESLSIEIENFHCNLIQFINQINSQNINISQNDTNEQESFNQLQPDLISDDHTIDIQNIENDTDYKDFQNLINNTTSLHTINNNHIEQNTLNSESYKNKKKNLIKILKHLQTEITNKPSLNYLPHKSLKLIFESINKDDWMHFVLTTFKYGYYFNDKSLLDQFKLSNIKNVQKSYKSFDIKIIDNFLQKNPISLIIPLILYGYKISFKSPEIKNFFNNLDKIQDKFILFKTNIQENGNSLILSSNDINNISFQYDYEIIKFLIDHSSKFFKKNNSQLNYITALKQKLVEFNIPNIKTQNEKVNNLNKNFYNF